MANLRVREARPDDAPSVQAIYAYHVEHGTATFDTEAPDVVFWAAKIADILDRGWPFLAVEVGGEVLGYCYATQFRDRAAYARTCENSIYVAEEARGQRLGSLMLERLVTAARSAGFEQMIAVIGGGGPSSVALHARSGFEHAGRMKEVGFKFGQRLDTVYMQRDLREPQEKRP